MPEEETTPLTLDSREEVGTLARAADAPTASLLLDAVPPFARSPSAKLAILACACAMEATCYTLCVPFMTTHLHDAYAISIADAGFVFVAYTIGSVCSTPLVERVTEAVGCSGAICAGVLVLGISQCAFLLASALSALFAARFVSGLAAGLVWSAVLTSCHLMSLREGNMGTLFGTVLSAVSIGTMVGPALGGAMYRLGGWNLPFATSAAACVGFAAVVALLLPEEGRVGGGGNGGDGSARGAHTGTHKATLSDDGDGVVTGARAAGGGCRSIASTRLLAVLAIVMCGAMTFSSIDSVLPIHLRRAYDHSTLQTALLFFVISIFYGLAAPSFGSLADRTGKALHVSMAGLCGLAVLLPLFALPLPHWALFVVAALFGTSATVQLTPASTLLEQVAADVVGDHPTLTYAVFNCAYVSGMAIGPGVLAMLTDALTFQAAALCVSAGALAVSTVAACHLRAGVS